MYDCWSLGAERYWSESTPMASFSSAAAASKTPLPDRPDGVEDDVRAVVVERRRGGLATRRVGERLLVGLVGQPLHLDGGLRVDLLDARLEAGGERVDDRTLDAAHEADLVGLGLQAGGDADQEGALLGREGEVGDVVTLGRAVDDRELELRVLLGDLGHHRGVDEADRDDRVVARVGERAQPLLLGGVRLVGSRLGLLAGRVQRRRLAFLVPAAARSLNDLSPRPPMS